MEEEIKFEKTYNISNAAKIIGVSRNTINLRIKDGTIKTIRQGKVPKITLTEIKKYMNL